MNCKNRRTKYRHWNRTDRFFQLVSFYAGKSDLLGEGIRYTQGWSYGNASRIGDIVKDIEAGEERTETYLFAGARGNWIIKEIVVKSSSRKIRNKWTNIGVKKYKCDKIE